MMNTIYESAKMLGIVSQDDKVDTSHFQHIIVAPLGNAVPEDGILSYVSINNFRDILDAPNGSVLLFREDQADKLAALCANQHPLEVSVQAMYGIPGVTYERWFDESVYACPRLSYSPTISEIRESRDVAMLQEASRERSVHDKETAHRTRRDGSVRYHDDEGSIGLATE